MTHTARSKVCFDIPRTARTSCPFHSSVGSQVFHTKVINNNLNPVWNECFEAVVDQASGQKLRIELFDKDTAGADEELGRLSVPLESVRHAGEMEKVGGQGGETSTQIIHLKN